MSRLTRKNSENGFMIKGNIIDVCLMLQMEQQKYGKVKVSQYLKQKKAEIETDRAFVNPSYKAGN